MLQYEQTQHIQRNVRTILQRVGKVPLLLIVIWIWFVRWGEVSSFGDHTGSCDWNQWETWTPDSKPHRVLFVADPQLVDPHTYPDRPWPLSTLTILYTDLYMRRAYRQLLSRLQPDTVLFLGDLFDGGREWGVLDYESPEEQYRQYGQDFWLREYSRFQNMFVKSWIEVGAASQRGGRARRLITSLPGNHDLGFAGGINPKVRSRFEAHFGPTNRVDVIGNHSFVSLDTVSLSAMDQVDLSTGASGMSESAGGKNKNTEIWRPVQSFLDEASALRERRIKQELRVLGAQSSFPEMRQYTQKNALKHEPQVQELESFTPDPKPDPLTVATSQFPTIILSHVPFYRSELANCGPNRERGTAIPIHAGYQYQNVLTPLISRDIIDKLDASQVTQIYSGDDHDYCEIEHDEFTGRIREITVKSMSWAMGVRKPGVQLASLWNPIDLTETVTSASATTANKVTNMPRNTVQNHMCLLPDQLGIFIEYAKILVVTIIALVVRAVLWRPDSTNTRDLEKEEPLLPLTQTYTNGSSKRVSSPPTYPRENTSDSISSTRSTTSITSRKGLGGYGNIPAQSRSRSVSPSKTKFVADSDDWGMPTTAADRGVYARGYTSVSTVSLFSKLWLTRQSSTKLEAFLKSVVFVAGPVLGYYFWCFFADM